MLGKNMDPWTLGVGRSAYGKILSILDITISKYSLEDDSMGEDYGNCRSFV